MAAEIDVVHDGNIKRFHVNVEGQMAFTQYRQEGDLMVIEETQVPPALEGRGIGGALAKAALSYARANKHQVRVECSFVQGYLERHPEYQDLVVSE